MKKKIYYYERLTMNPFKWMACLVFFLFVSALLCIPILNFFIVMKVEDNLTRNKKHYKLIDLLKEDMIVRIVIKEEIHHYKRDLK